MLPCSLTWMLWHCCWYFGVLPSFPTSIRRAYTLQSALFSTLTPTLALSPTVTNLPSQRSAKIHRIWFNCTFPIDGYIMLHLHCSEMIHWFHRWIPSLSGWIYCFVLRLHVCRHFLDGELPFCCFNTMMANSHHGRGTWRSGTGYCCAYAGQCRGSSMAMSTERCWRPGHQDPPELRSGLRSSKIW